MHIHIYTTDLFCNMVR